MSVVQTIMETIAKVLPDQEVDPLIAHTDYVGQALQRVDGHAKVVGEARFTAEFKLDNLIYAALVHSNIAKGKIRKIDTEAAEQAPGVLAVITYQNMPRIKAPPIVDFHNIGKGFAMSELPEITIGDAEKAFAEADKRVGNIYRAPRYNHNAIEPHATTALWNEDGSLLVFDATQSVNLTAHTLAYVFDLKTEDVRVVAPFLGG